MKQNENQHGKRREQDAPPTPPWEDPLFDIQQVASMTECTGILPAQVATEEEGESVSRLESIHPILPRHPGKHP